jgi:hypothetical protein
MWVAVGGGTHGSRLGVRVSVGIIAGEVRGDGCPGDGWRGDQAAAVAGGAVEP